jgi:hypothetical protein
MSSLQNIKYFNNEFKYSKECKKQKYEKNEKGLFHL